MNIITGTSAHRLVQQRKQIPVLTQGYGGHAPQFFHLIHNKGHHGEIRTAGGSVEVKAQLASVCEIQMQLETVQVDLDGPLGSAAHGALRFKWPGMMRARIFFEKNSKNMMLRPVIWAVGRVAKAERKAQSDSEAKAMSGIRSLPVPQGCWG
jgi:hypothetical protein